ncbi:RIO1 family protein [Toxoplasma gondii FOU]|uniref:non-specific serine/threonine protein kinase n=1 Tax=Toxoplasma gondii FOU TaxID=943167 RepID=A0A086JBZ5_TOXGO|nr:RIO1 family protein [Toxoplasma gondii FOU]
MVVNWVMKEFRNLLRLHAAGVPCPRPVDVSAHVLLMTFVGFAADAVPAEAAQAVCRAPGTPEPRPRSATETETGESTAPFASQANLPDDEALELRRETGFAIASQEDDAAPLRYAAAPRLKDLHSVFCCSAAASASLQAWEALYVQACFHV